MTHDSLHTEDESLRRNHEVADARFKPVLYTGLGLLGIMALGFLLSWGMYEFFWMRTSNPGTKAETLTRQDFSAAPPGPNLQPDPHAVLQALRRSEDSLLTGYGWVDEEKGIVRVPIERAMQLLLQEGLAHQQREDSQ
jgi:hypothetical protein